MSARPLSVNNQYREAYLAGIEKRALHHAPNVVSVVRALAGFVDKYGIAHESTQRKSVSSYGIFGNISYFTSARTGRQYRFRYEHSTQSIELLNGNTVIAAFHNSSHYPDQIEAIFRQL